MRYNGLVLILDMALARLGDPEALRWREALILGALREDVRWLPVLGKVHEHLSFTHFSGRWLPGGFLPFLWPGPQAMAERFFDKAVEAGRQGHDAAAYVQLGRAAHLLIDMACPVHAHRVIHETDPYEWHIEAHHEELAGLSVPALPSGGPGELASSMARFTRGFQPDATRSAHGRLLKRLGWRRPLRAEEARRQAREILPVAAAHVAALIRLLARRGEKAAQGRLRPALAAAAA